MTNAKERLESLKGEIPPDDLPPEDGAPIPPEGEGSPSTEIPPEQLAEMVIDFGNKFFIEQGLTAMNAMQVFILRMGIIGTAKKYNLSFDVEKYPEIALLVGAAWVAIDKGKEYKAKHPKEEKAKEHIEESSAEPGDTAASLVSEMKSEVVS